MDKIDRIIDALSQAIPDVSFGRDAMETDTPEDWGAVELAGGDGFVADGTVIDTIWKVHIWMCISDRGTEIIQDVKEVLQEFAEEWFARWNFPERAYLYDVDKVMWHWTIQIPEDMEEPDEDDTGDENGDGTGDGDGDG